MAKVHAPPDEFVHPVKVYDHDRRRLAVKHFVRGVRQGDYLLIQEDGAPRRYLVMGNVRHCPGVWYAELLASPPAPTIAGTIYRID